MKSTDMSCRQPVLSPGSAPLMSLIESASADGVDKEKCIVAQYRTTPDQRNKFVAHLTESSNTKTKLPLEWVIDIADESNGWFYGTAYHYNDETNMLHVMVPDKLNPSFDGEVLLDYRTVHLIECVDGKTEALFNKCVRDSIVKVKWDLEWFEEDPTAPLPDGSAADAVPGKWVKSCARFYIRTANQILVEDNVATEGQQGYVMLTADLNVRLHKCSKDKGMEDFTRLVTEGLVQSSPEAVAMATSSGVGSAKKEGKNATDYGKDNDKDNVSVKKLADMSKNLKDCLSDLLDDRENTQKDLSRIATAFKLFALEGDLDEGLKLLEKTQQIHFKEKNDECPMDAIADDAWYLSQKLEKGVHKLAKLPVSVKESEKRV